MVASLVTCVASTTAGCANTGKENEGHARRSLEFLTKLVDQDVEEIAKGLPAGAQSLAARFEKKRDWALDPQETKVALLKVQRETPDLRNVKSSFFALAAPDGTAIRNNLEQDVMAGQKLFPSFPGLDAAQSKYTTTIGAFPDPSGKTKDRDFIAGAPVVTADGKLQGIYVTGWTYRRFGYHLFESLKRELSDKKSPHFNGKTPIFYVTVFDETGVYGAPLTPEVNEEALKALDIFGKTQAGPYIANDAITGRNFGIGAARTPSMGKNTGVCVLVSAL